MTSALGRSPRSRRAVLAALILIVAMPATASGGGGGWVPPPTSLVVSTGAVPGTTFVPLINSGDVAFGETFSGLPDGIGAVPRRNHFPEWLPWVGSRADYVDLYVNHEESHVPFGLTPTSVFADFQDSSVTRVRVSTTTHQVTDMEVVLPASAGLIRFCSSFMAGPREGFPFYTLLLNEESNDILPVPSGAVYGSDPGAGAGSRQAGYSAWYNTVTGKYDVIAGAGRHNHENQVVVPGGWWNKIVSLSGDDTFTTTSTVARPNLSQLYMFAGRNFTDFTRDRGALYAFRVTATQAGPVNPADPLNNANDYLEIAPGQTWKGEFIRVPDDIARGTADRPADPNLPQEDLPQNLLEDWSMANNVFEFVRVEDIDYDPDNPRVVYFADTGNSRLFEDAATGRLYRLGSSDPNVGNSTLSNGRVFRMVLNKHDPMKVDEFSIVLDASTVGMRAPDNLDAGSNSLILQEDASNARIWRWNYGPNPADWTHVATVDRDGDPATSDSGESSGVLDVSRWFGAGWWALDVQAHDSHVVLDPTSANPADWYTWSTPPIPPGGAQYRKHLEAGQLLLMYLPGS
jgi:hypothetical protein